MYNNVHVFFFLFFCFMHLDIIKLEKISFSFSLENFFFDFIYRFTLDRRFTTLPTFT